MIGYKTKNVKKSYEKNGKTEVYYKPVKGKSVEFSKGKYYI
jgi:hypothetical protein